MRIHNVRLGFATNSSSTHSIVVLPGGASDEGPPGEFGWDFFTAGSPQAKRHYLALTTFYALRRQCGDEIARTVAEAWSGFPRSQITEDDHIDHQSVISLPTGWDGKGVDRDFFEAFKAFLLRDDVAILGGNDNTDERHPLLGRDGVKDLDSYDAFSTDPGPSSSLVVRRDVYDGNEYWTMFSRKSGMKLRVSFGDQDLHFKPTKASSPELIDIKITDYCPIGCQYCYQNSTTKGLHAPLKSLQSLAYACGDLQVFEVALGGGETTMHPEFERVLRDFRDQGVIPNFTTKSKKWLSNTDAVRTVKECGGAFAFSAEDAQEAGYFLDAAEKAGFKWDSCSGRSTVYIQHVMGTSDRYQFAGLVEACAKRGAPLTLLGYKQVGRGKSLLAKRYDWWLDELVRLRSQKVYIKVGIDTALAGEFAAQLQAAGVDGRLYEVREGAFSMYVDAVACQAGPSSYAPESMRAIGHVEKEWDSERWFTSPDEIREVFASF